MKNRSFPLRLGFALSGLRLALRRERSLRTQAAAAVLAVAVLAAAGASALWWALVLMAIALVLTAELFNAAIEALADHLHPECHPAIGAVKDMAAAAVLVASLGAAAVGALFLWSLV